MVPAERTVTVGVGHGKKAARNIDGWLRGQAYEPAPKHEIASFDKLNTWYYADAPRTVQPAARDRAAARSTFDEVVGGLDESNALYEARRCLSCGNCFSCDNCYGVCPDNAVIKLAEAAENPNVNGYADRPRLLQGLRAVRRRMPLRRDRDDPGSDLTGRVMADQLTALDATFLELEEADQGAHMHIGGVMVFDPRPDGAAPPLELVCRHLGERLGALPRYFQQLSEPHTGGLGWPEWRASSGL